MYLVYYIILKIEKKIDASEKKQDTNIQGILNQHGDVLMQKFSVLLQGLDNKQRLGNTMNEKISDDDNNILTIPRKRMSKYHSVKDTSGTDDTEEIDFE